MTTILTNARIVTSSELISGTLAFEDALIRSIDGGRSGLLNAIDCEGDYLLPGLVDIHTDNVEKHVFPRSGIRWPSLFNAIVAHDREVACAGITTVLDALSLGDFDSAGRRREILPEIVDTITWAKSNGSLRADHHLHFRCEVTDEAVLELFEPRASHPLLRLVSLMDHTPGQRQTRDPAVFRKFREDRDGVRWSDDEFDAYLAEKQAFQAIHGARVRGTIQQIATDRRLPLASHDDTTAEHVEQAAAERSTISEFPTTIEAAERAHVLGLKTVMGSPNVVLGESQSGNVSARELASRGLLDVLASDYVPSSLLEATFVLNAKLGINLPAAVSLASSAVAQMLGLSDRGSLAVGLRADLVQVRVVSGYPLVRAAWSGGERIC